MRTAGRMAAWFSGALLWLTVACLALEAWERYRMPRVEQAARAYGDKRMAEGYARNLAVLQATPAPPPPDFAPKELPARGEFAGRDEQGRMRLAAERSETIFLCNDRGIVQAVYPDGHSASVEEFASRIKTGAPIQDSFPETERQDAANAFLAAVSGKNRQTRDYPLPRADGSLNVFEFTFVPVGGENNAVAVFVRDSIWDVLWKKFRPHVYRDDPYIFWTNAQGFRGDEIALPKPAGIYRIVCIGGSTTAEGPRNDLTYPAIMEREVRKRLGTDRIEVVNAGIFALNSFGETERFDDYLNLQPDLIVHYNLVNDLNDLKDWIIPKSAAAEPLKTLKWIGRKSSFLRNRFNRLLMLSEPEMEARLREGIIANLRTMASRVQAAGVQMAVCSFACPAAEIMSQTEKDFFNWRMNAGFSGAIADIESYAWAVEIYNRLVRDLCREQGLIYIPVAERLRGGIDAYSDQCHMFLDAMQRKAEIIAEVVTAHIRIE
ncbi:MAG TPA: SGNH/GDSL hydrolase family protein [Candidatus Hydrogenedentes bacterium]|nr:SGNH/GDSL hydrolase family protein [Candidatus Hydrogenedentota bacterium]HRT21583.1 SGNH/GDSL hydrolase family protein [Candidatus Hydrogenedentota bacterium]HRT66659.1 SGNH/GDSL hydrolase family protein [Candidatus Hydrogenedentota bacterium]